MERLRNLDELRNLRESLQKTKKALTFLVCGGSACRASGSLKVADRITEEARKRGVDFEVKITGCRGMCSKSPNLKIEPSGIFYTMVRPETVPNLMSYTLEGKTFFRPLLYRDDILHEPIARIEDIPLYKKQLRLVLRHNGLIDPKSIEDYIRVNGYSALEKALFFMTPDDVLDEIDRANLRGRGGAGFPAGKKWRHTKNSKSKIKFVVANGDEGDPGAFMDRAIMEGNPHSVIEGMIICAYAIGAQYGFIYVRDEYPVAVENLGVAISQARELGLLGENILGTGFNFDIEIRRGAGAFVCGESTALIASIEGYRGFPRPRPPRLSDVGGGVWGYPTNLNNIETFANVPIIIERGADYFLSIGTKDSPGTKVFALAGKVKNSCLVEVPMGISLREIVYDIGGGIIGNKKFKAIQTGGPSGGCLPESLLDLSVDFDTLTKAGSMMGSGGMIVLDEESCMVDIAKYFLSFCQSESCGKCPPCRVGTYQMLQILERITNGRGEKGDIERLEELGRHIQKSSLCGLGQSAPNPVLSTIKYFREEYEEHIFEKYCRAKECKGLGVYIIDREECFLCGLCQKACAFDAIKDYRDRLFIDQDYCTKCRACYLACPIGAVKIEKAKDSVKVK
ncbi:MAG: NADH-quinone oxidoreductase subunit NuoF [Thermodesulfovibrionales bacterium]|nr:NADH-quinone oxidoreductase subunit NuoF [Thermodesulfovibrionales bacterium]